MGRPSLYTPELVAAICERLAKGEPLAVICRDEGMPHPSTVRAWMAKDEDVSRAIACAREDGEDAIAAECLLIADTPVEGVVEKAERVALPLPEGSPDGAEPAFELRVVEVRKEDMLGHRKLQIETRMKLLAKWNPKKWGDRTTLAGDPEAPLLGHVPDDQLDRRIKELLAKNAEA